MSIGKTAMISLALFALGACGGSGGDSSGGTVDGNPSKDVPFSLTDEGKALASAVQKEEIPLLVKNAFEMDGSVYNVGDEFIATKFKKGELEIVGDIKLLAENSMAKVAVYKGNYGTLALAATGEDVHPIAAAWSSPVADLGELRKLKASGKVVEYSGKAISANGTVFGNLGYKIDFGKMMGSGDIEVTQPGDIKSIKLAPTQMSNIEYQKYLPAYKDDMPVAILIGRDGRELPNNASYFSGIRGYHGEIVDGGVVYEDNGGKYIKKYFYGERTN